ASSAPHDRDTGRSPFWSPSSAGPASPDSHRAAVAAPGPSCASPHVARRRAARDQNYPDPAVSAFFAPQSGTALSGPRWPSLSADCRALGLSSAPRRRRISSLFLEHAVTRTTLSKRTATAGGFVRRAARLLLTSRILGSSSGVIAAARHFGVAALRQRKSPHASIAHRGFAALLQRGRAAHGI